MVDTVLKPSRRMRLGIATLVVGIHLVVLVALVQAFAPQVGRAVLGPVTEAFNVTVPVPAPPPPSKPVARPPQPSSQGPAAPAGRLANPKEVAAPSPRISIAAPIAPPIAGHGVDVTAGALDSGQGTGAAGSGQGTGAGGQGSGNGAGRAKVIKVSGDIVSARDYPRDTRMLRLGSSVTVSLTVGTDGRAKDCRIVRPSRDPEADRITCRLAMDRFRFEPARDATGSPIEAVYGWHQRWFAPNTR